MGCQRDSDPREGPGGTEKGSTSGFTKTRSPELICGSSQGNKVHSV